MTKRIVELSVGDTIPDGAKLINTRITRGQVIGQSRTIKPGIPFLTPDVVRTVTTYEEIPVYVYEIDELTSNDCPRCGGEFGHHVSECSSKESK